MGSIARAGDDSLDVLSAWFEAMGREPVRLRKKLRQNLPCAYGKNGLPERGRIRKCVPKWATLVCENGHKVKAEIGRCYAEDCGECAKGGDDGKQAAKSLTARRRARGVVNKGVRRSPEATAVAWVEDGGTLLHTVFTLPTALQPVAGDCQWWAKVQRRLRGALKKRFGMVWAFVTSHPCGDRTGPETFLPHLEALWGREDRIGRLDLDKLRDLWRKALHWPEDRELGNPEHAFITRRTKPRKGKGNYRGIVKHVVHYMLRPFPGWSWWRGKALRAWGKVPWVREYVRRPLCPICGTPYQLIGVSEREPEGIPKLTDRLREARAPP